MAAVGVFALYTVKAVIVGCKIPWPFFSPKPPALTSINRREAAIDPEIASINVC